MSEIIVDVKISPEGKISLDIDGAKGTECTDISKHLEKLIGSPSKREFKSEYFSRPQPRTSQDQARQGRR